MKKLLTLALAVGLVSAFAGSVKAAALETSGELRVRSWYVDNYVINNESTEWWDQRLRLNMVWPVAEGVKVAARADILEGMWGTSSDPSISILEDSTTGAHTTSISRTSGFDARPQIIFDQVYMQVAVPQTPLTITAGRQDVSWGTGYYTKSDNRDRFKLSAKIDPVSLVFAYDKNTEIFGAHGGANGVDDNRGYVLAAVIPAGPVQIGLLGAYAKNDTAPTTAGKQTRYVGDVYVTGKGGPVDIKAEVTYISGENEVVGGAKTDVTGLGAYAGVSIAPIPMLSIGFEGAYAGGDDPSTTDENEGGFRADYQSPFWSVILYNNLDYPGYLGSWAGNRVTNDMTNDFSVSNSYAGKATVTVMPLKGLAIIGAAVYASAIEDVVVSTTKDGVTTKTTHKADALGTEFDLLVKYNLTDNAYFLGGFGYLAAGDFFGDVDDPLGLMGSVVVNF
jgi:hypothetical protein